MILVSASSGLVDVKDTASASVPLSPELAGTGLTSMKLYIYLLI